MDGSSYPRRMGKVEKKKLRPKKKKEREPDGVRVKRGDVLILRGPGNHSSVGVVTSVAKHGGPHRLVDEHGRDREVYKPASGKQASPFSDAYDGKIVVVGHDEQWLRFEEGLADKRRELSRPHQTAAWRHIVDSQRK